MNEHKGGTLLVLVLVLVLVAVVEVLFTDAVFMFSCR